MLAILIQGRVPFEIRPVALVWGLLLFPTLFLWTSFVMAVQTITRNRYTTYAIGLAVLALHGLPAASPARSTGWATGPSGTRALERHQRARARSPGAGAEPRAGRRPGDLLLALTVRFLPAARPTRPGSSTGCDPGRSASQGLRLAPWALIPLVAGVWLALEVSWGHEGGSGQEAGQRLLAQESGDVSRRARSPTSPTSTSTSSSFPRRGRYRASGTYDLVNPADKPLREILLTAGPHWEDLSWTFDDKPYTPDRSRAALRLHPAQASRARPDGPDRFPPRGDIPSGHQQERGRRHGVHPALRQWCSPASVPASCPCWASSTRSASRTTTAPTPRNTPTTSTRDRPTPSWEQGAPFTTRVKITGPADFTFNSVGHQDRGHGKRTTAGPWSGRATIPSASSTSWPAGGT